MHRADSKRTVPRSAMGPGAAVWFFVVALNAWPVAGRETPPVVAVGAVETSRGPLRSTTLRTALESALAEMPAFTTMKNKQLSAILAERGIADASIASGHAAFVGSGIDFLLSSRAESSVASKLSPLGSLLRVLRSGAECSAVVALAVGVVDMRSGQAVFRSRVTHRKPVQVVYPPGADYSVPCRYANRSRKWRALQAASEAAAADAARKLTLALFPISLVRIADTEVTLSYGDSFLSVGDRLKVVARKDALPGRDSASAREAVAGYIAVAAVSSRHAVAEVVYAGRPFAPDDVAVALGRDERRRMDRMLAATAKTAAKRSRACAKARQRVRRHCGRDPDSRRCKDTEAAAAAYCDA